VGKRAHPEWRSGKGKAKNKPDELNCLGGSQRNVGSLSLGSASGRSQKPGRDKDTQPEGGSSSGLFFAAQGRFDYIYLNKLLQRQNGESDCADINTSKYSKRSLHEQGNKRPCIFFVRGREEMRKG
jgi:hypothetical protein